MQVWACPGGYSVNPDDDEETRYRHKRMLHIFRELEALNFADEKQCLSEIKALAARDELNKDWKAGLLLGAVYAQSLPLVRHLLAQGACCNFAGYPVLLAAIRQNNVPLVKLLLSAGADPHFLQEDYNNDKNDVLIRTWYCKSLEMAMQCQNDEMVKVIWQACRCDDAYSASVAVYYAVRNRCYAAAQWLLEQNTSPARLDDESWYWIDAENPKCLAFLQCLAQRAPEYFCSFMRYPIAYEKLWDIGAAASFENIKAFDEAGISLNTKQKIFKGAIAGNNISAASFFIGRGLPLPMSKWEYHSLYLHGKVSADLHQMLQKAYGENVLDILPMLQIASEEYARGISAVPPLSDLLQKYRIFTPEQLKGKFDVLEHSAANENREVMKMEMTPEFLTLLKQLLALCVKEAERTKEVEHTHEQIQAVVKQIHCILASME